MIHIIRLPRPPVQNHRRESEGPLKAQRRGSGRSSPLGASPANQAARLPGVGRGLAFGVRLCRRPG